MQEVFLSRKAWTDYGNFLFTTARVEKGNIIWLDSHFERLSFAVRRVFHKVLKRSLLSYLKSNLLKKKLSHFNRLRIAVRLIEDSLLVEIYPSYTRTEPVIPLSILATEAKFFPKRNFHKGQRYDFFDSARKRVIKNGFDERAFFYEDSILEGSYGSFLGVRDDLLFVPAFSWIESITLKKITSFLTDEHSFKVSSEPLALSSLSSLDSLIHLNCFRLARPIKLVVNSRAESLFHSEASILAPAIQSFNGLFSGPL